MISYRKLSELDIDALEVIENACFKDPFPRKDLLYELNENPVAYIIGAFSDNELIGFIDYMITFISATITQIAVMPTFRGQAIATTLLTLMEESFPKDVDDMVETITLEVRESNEPAYKLYLKNGYERVLLKKNYYKNGENAIYMIKRMI